MADLSDVVHLGSPTSKRKCPLVPNRDWRSEKSCECLTHRSGTETDHALLLPHPRHESLHPAHHLRKAPLLHSLHHLLHLLELIQEAIHFLHRHTRTRRNTPFTRGFEDLRPHPLSGSHRVDDAFDAAQLLFVHLRGLQALSELRRELVDQSRYPAHLAHLADLLLEVLEVESLALLHLLGEF